MSARRVWVKKEAHGRNEVLDASVLSYAPLHGFYAFGGRLDREGARLVRKAADERAIPIVDAAVPPRAGAFTNPSSPDEATSPPTPPRTFHRRMIRSRWMAHVLVELRAKARRLDLALASFVEAGA